MKEISSRIPATSPIPERRVEKLKWTFSRVIELLTLARNFLTFIENDKNSHQLSASHHEWSETYVLTVSNSETRAVTKSRVKMRMKYSLEFFFYLNNISATLPVELRKTNLEYFLCFQFSRRSKHIFVGRYIFRGSCETAEFLFFGSQQASNVHRASPNFSRQFVWLSTQLILIYGNASRDRGVTRRGCGWRFALAKSFNYFRSSTLSAQQFEQCERWLQGLAKTSERGLLGVKVSKMY